MLKEYRKIATIKAEQYHGTEDQVHRYGIHTHSIDLGEYLPTREGDMEISVGDWIATGVDGEHWSIKNAIFRRTYEQIEID